MKRIVLAVVTLLCVTAMSAAAQKVSHLQAKLDGFHEVATPTVITNATGTFTATLNNDNTLTYTVTYNNLSSAVLQSHIHVGATKISGGVSIFLCTNLGNGPADTPACPDDASHSGTVTRTVSAADVIGPTGQGVGVGDFADVVRAIVNHVTYVNVHSANFPAGEIRGQIRPGGDDEGN
jgi:hypothetical protein